LLLAPRLAEGLYAEEFLPINLIRVTSYLSPSEEVLGMTTQEVDPTLESWTLEFQVPVSPDLTEPQFFVIIELIHLSEAGEDVQWSGKSVTLPLDLTTVPEIREVPVVRGPVDNLEVSTVVIGAHVDELVEGDSVRLEAVATTDADEASPVIFWNSLDGAVAAVSTEGRVVTLGPGEARLVATAGPKADTTVVSVLARPAAVRITPDTVVLTSIEEETSVSGTVIDVRGDAVAGEEVSWASLDPDIVVSVGGGVFRALARGSAQVAARSVSDSALVGTATLIVTQVPAVLEIQPYEAFLARVGDSISFSAASQDAGGFEIPDAEYTWASLDSSIVTVSDSGTVTGVGAGLAGVVASAGQAADTVLVNVGRELTRVDVAPLVSVVGALGRTVQLSAVALDVAEVPVETITRFTWTSEDTLVARVDSVGLVTATGDGTTIISAAVADYVGSATVTVERPLASLSVSPGSYTLEAIDETVRLVAEGVDSLGFAVPAHGTWSSSNPDVATIDTLGVVTAVANGETTISVTAEGVTATAVITVRFAPVSVRLVPDSLQFQSIGDLDVFEAVVRDADGLEVPDAEFSWTVEPAGVVSVRQTLPGSLEVTAARNGSADVTVTVSAQGRVVSTTASVVVQQTVRRLTLSPTETTLASRGESQQFAVVAFDAGGTALEIPVQMAWGSSEPSVLTVSDDGLATAVEDGTARVLVAAGGVQASAPVSVARVPVRLSVTPDAPDTLASLGTSVQLQGLAFDAADYPIDTEVAWQSLDEGVASVDVSGAVTAVGEGVVSIIATSGALADTVEITVHQAMAEIRVTPPSWEFAAGGITDRLFEAVAYDAGGSPLGAEHTFVWSTSNAAVATVDQSGLVSVTGTGAATVTATAEGTQGSAQLLVDVTVAALRVSPSNHGFKSAGETQQLTAVALDGDGEVIEGVSSVQWASSDTMVVKLGVTGVAMAVGDGVASVTARLGEVDGVAALKVARTVGSVAIEPAEPELLTHLGDSLELVATVRDSLGSELPTEVTWSSLDPEVAAVDGTGLVTALGGGTARIVALALGKGDTVTVRVQQAVHRIEVGPDPFRFVDVGDVQDFVPVAFDVGESLVPGATDFTWSSSDPEIISVDENGAVTALAEGSARVSAVTNGVSGEAEVRVGWVVATVRVTPEAPSLGFLGETAQLAAVAVDVTDTLLPIQPVFTWTSSDTSVAVVDQGGLVTAVGNGTALIAAEGDGVIGQTAMTVDQVVATIDVTPSSLGFSSQGETLAFSAVAFDAGGSEVATADFTWTSSDASVVTIDSGGLVTAVGDGSSVVSAARAGVLGSASVTVALQVVTVSVVPDAFTFLSEGETRQLEATALDAGGSALPSATGWVWSSADPRVVVVDDAGMATAVSAGTTTVTAEVEGVVGTTTLTVAPAVASLVISPSIPETLVFMGQDLPLEAVTADALGNRSGRPWPRSRPLAS
jgi:uncharacterized protein YjdB